MGRLGEDITFGQLRTFACAARLGSFKKAADQLGISQPAVSEQITTLEARLGHKLFGRRRGTTPLLTDEGSAILQDVLEILEASENLFARKSAVRRQKVRICIGPYLKEAYLNPALAEIYGECPELEIEFSPMLPVHEAMAALEQGQLDLMVYTTPPTGAVWPNTTKIGDVPVSFIAPPGTQAKLDSGEITLADLNIMIPANRSSATERWVSKLLARLGVPSTRLVTFLDSGEAMPALVEQGLGIAYLMNESVCLQLEQGRLERLKVELPPMQRLIALSPHAPRIAEWLGNHLFQKLHRAAREQAG